MRAEYPDQLDYSGRSGFNERVATNSALTRDLQLRLKQTVWTTGFESGKFDIMASSIWAGAAAETSASNEIMDGYECGGNQADYRKIKTMQITEKSKPCGAPNKRANCRA